MYALDTNTLIYFFQGRGNVSEHLLSKLPEEIVLPAIVQYEIETGLAKSENPEQRRNQFHEMLEIITILPFDSKSALQSAKIRASLEKAGTPIGPYDILIAGTARANNAVLVTHNTKEFSRIPGLKIEDWWD